MPPPIALRKSWWAARATFAIATLTALVWLVAFVLRWSDPILIHAGFFPERLAGLPGDDLLVPAWLTPLSALFVHAGFMHLLLNMLALIIFGRAVEPAVGILGLAILYLAGAAAAAAAYYFVHPTGFPWFGAGGGVGAVLGGYALLFGRNQAPGGRQRPTPWRYALWLCVGWILLALLVSYTFARTLAVYFAAAYLASFAIGLLLARPLLLLHYRKA